MNEIDLKEISDALFSYGELGVSPPTPGCPQLVAVCQKYNIVKWGRDKRRRLDKNGIELTQSCPRLLQRIWDALDNAGMP